MAKVQPNMPSPPAGAVVGETSSKPGTEAPKAKKVKSPRADRIVHAALAPDAEGKPTKKIESLDVLSDYSKKFRPLKLSQFANEDLYYDWKIKQHEDAIVNLRNEKNDVKSTGGREKKKVEALISRIDDLIAGLAGKGIDVEALKASLVKNITEAKATAA